MGNFMAHACLAVVVCVAVLYVPGYLFARSLSVARFASVAIAPMISIFFLAVLGIVLFEVGDVRAPYCWRSPSRSARLPAGEQGHRSGESPERLS
ncbi:MAG: hypothetical protein ACLSVD_09145 [Eggerthellaceae bacterium]